MKSKLLKKNIFGMAILLFVTTLIFNAGCKRKIIDYTNPFAKLTSQAIFMEFKADDKKAYEKYIGKLVEINGVVERTGSDSTFRPYIVFKGDESGDVQCFFAKEYEDQASQMKKGDSVTVCGIMLTRVTNVTLDSCMIVKK